jgi:hypothetical protein
MTILIVLAISFALNWIDVVNGVKDGWKGTRINAPR